MRATLLPPLLLLSACATGAQIPDVATLQSAANSRFAGRPVDAVIARFGAPDGQFLADRGIHVLLWDDTATLRLHETQRSTTSGRIGTAWANVPYREASQARVGYDAQYACTMQVGVRPDGTVEAIGFDGRMGACQDFMP